MRAKTGKVLVIAGAAAFLALAAAMLSEVVYADGEGGVKKESGGKAAFCLNGENGEGIVVIFDDKKEGVILEFAGGPCRESGPSGKKGKGDG